MLTLTSAQKKRQKDYCTCARRPRLLDRSALSTSVLLGHLVLAMPLPRLRNASRPQQL